jgi:hypothetical protein
MERGASKKLDAGRKQNLFSPGYGFRYLNYITSNLLKIKEIDKEFKGEGSGGL